MGEPSDRPSPLLRRHAAGDATLDEASLPLKRHAEIIAEVKSAPRDSYLLVGPPGTGKTHIMVALLREALRMIIGAVKNGLRHCLFLDEIDKFRPTEAKMNKLIELVDAVWEANGQIVATTNKTYDEMVAQPGRDRNKVGTTLRRIGRGEGAHTIDFVMRRNPLPCGINHTDGEPRPLLLRGRAFFDAVCCSLEGLAQLNLGANTPTCALRTSTNPMLNALIEISPTVSSALPDLARDALQEAVDGWFYWLVISSAVVALG